ncbi:branched-chain amino acid transporter permease [Streptomyces sp. NPDC017993]|uniref:branched-chain amino acid transporter permease n=1 Tax=Streptomyces sp. NPDC017993 TaxID=3365027 RepID=UPI0037B4332A
MPEASYIVGAIAVMCAVTFALRATPFVLFKNFSGSPLLDFLRGSLPPGIMVILVAYSIHTVDFTRYPYGLPAVAGIMVCGGLYHWRKSPLLAIVLGTATYMVLINALH